MTIYVYRCRVCGAEFERLQSFSDTTVPRCPEGHEDVVRLLKPPAIHFKGSGWYITDSKGNGHNPASQPAKASNGKESTAETSTANEEK